MQIVHLLLQGLAPDDDVACVGAGGGPGSASNKVVLLHAVPQEIEVLTLGLLLRLILLKDVEALFLLKRLIAHVFEALSAAIDHVDSAILVARVVRRDPLVIRRMRAGALPRLLRHLALHQRVLRHLALADEHSAGVANHVGALASGSDGHAASVYLLLHDLVVRTVPNHLLLLV